jgi:cyclohexadieny/prephenate dehydrogenase
MAVIYDRVALIGLGLIAGSMAHAMRRGGLAGEIVGTARSAETRDDRARDRPVRPDRRHERRRPWRARTSWCFACRSARWGRGAGDRAASRARRDGDGCGLGQARRDRGGRPHLPEGVHFVPGHPLAGTEHSGPTSGFAELFDNRYTLLTPVGGNGSRGGGRLRRLWEGCGANVEEMDADHHDLVLAVTSTRRT